MKKFTPLVSVIIPTYNRSSYVLNAINSVISQTYKNIEIIVVDDNSSDDTEEVIKNIKEPIFYIKQKENKGGSCTRNVGIDVAKGEYMAFLDDDDEWLPEKIEAQIANLGDYKASITGYYLLGNKKIKKVFRLDELKLQNILKINPFGPGSGLLVKSSIMKNIKFDESLPNGQDLDVLISILNDYNIKYIKEALYIVDDGQHERITNHVIRMSVLQIEKNMRVIDKHKVTLGDYWYRYRAAYRYLSYLSKAENKRERIVRGISRVGFIPVAHVLFDNIFRKLRYLFDVYT